MVGAEKGGAVLMRILRGGRPAGPRIKVVNRTNAPATVVHGGDRPEAVFLGEITDGKINGVYAVRDPDKPAGVAVARRTSR
ncbi:RNA polymerase ECF-subfamily sigma factor [Streptomyces hygroscopicus subsp. limoneus]|nr:RNA polymerase ECF-subfamily sigma factor [Streptomyces hygroscopicus subsp. limoneus]